MAGPVPGKCKKRTITSSHGLPTGIQSVTYNYPSPLPAGWTVHSTGQAAGARNDGAC